MKTKFLVVVFDALRPEFVTPELMPNLHAFQNQGVRYSNSRSVFPTETRVNQTAVITGCTPGSSGIVANYFLAGDIWPDRVLNTGADEELSAAFTASGDNLIQVPTLGEYLTAAGLRFASLSAGTPGGGRLINHTAEQHGTFRLAMRALQATQPTGVLDQVLASVGPLPDYQRPATACISWAVGAYLEFVLPEIAPHVMLLWLCEPDETFHYHGIGSEESLTTIRHADSEFGKILQYHSSDIKSGQLQVIAMSDHGQVSLSGDAIDIVKLLNEAGMRAGASPGSEVDYVVRIHNAGGIWVKDNDPELSRKLVEFLLGSHWCGPIFSRGGIAGTLPLEAVCLNHPRAPTVAVTLRTSDQTNPFNCDGLTVHDAPYPEGGGCHGGLSSDELHNFLSMHGSAFKQQTDLQCPASNIDITPTILHLLGVKPQRFDGRVLYEALNHGRPDKGSLDTASANDTDTEQSVKHSELCATNSNGSTTRLSLTDYYGVRYLNRAWVE